MNSGSNIASNVEEVRKRIAAAAERGGRKAEDVHIIAVTKTMGVDVIKEAVDAGVYDLGENRVQELMEKYDHIDGGCRWHLIGHLQTNKVKYIIDKVSLIHSVDSLELVQEIQKRAEKAGKVMDILIQVNVSGEESKFGISPERVRDFLLGINGYKNIRVRGLMTVAPFAENPEEIRWVFRDLHKIFIDIKQERIDNIYMDYLSMGMSNDFEVAVEEGANMVRIGTAIFGRRNYT